MCGSRAIRTSCYSRQAQRANRMGRFVILLKSLAGQIVALAARVSAGCELPQTSARPCVRRLCSIRSSPCRLRERILNKRSLFVTASAALAVAGTLAGCGGTEYFAGRNLPPSGITNRVLIAIQNPSPLSKGALQFVDAFYD